MRNLSATQDHRAKTQALLSHKHWHLALLEEQLRYREQRFPGASMRRCRVILCHMERGMVHPVEVTRFGGSYERTVRHAVPTGAPTTGIPTSNPSTAPSRVPSNGSTTSPTTAPTFPPASSIISPTQSPHVAGIGFPTVSGTSSGGGGESIALAAGIGGGLAALAILVFPCFCCAHRRSSSDTHSPSQSPVANRLAWFAAKRAVKEVALRAADEVISKEVREQAKSKACECASEAISECVVS